MRNDLPALRQARGWSQQELARRLAVSRQTVNAIETGRYDPSLPLAFRLAALLGRRIEEMFFDDAPATDRDGSPAPGDAPARPASVVPGPRR